MKNSLEATAVAPVKTIKLDTLSVSELKKVATEKKLQFNDKIKKAQLIELIQTGKFTEIEVISKPIEKTLGTFKIGSGAKFPAPLKTSIASIRFLVSNYMKRNAVEKVKDVTIELPSGTVIHADKINTIKSFIVDKVQTIYAEAKGGKVFENERNFVSGIVKNANNLPINWAKVGVNDDELIKDFINDTLSDMVKAEKISKEIANGFIGTLNGYSTVNTLKLLK